MDATIIEHVIRALDAALALPCMSVDFGITQPPEVLYAVRLWASGHGIALTPLPDDGRFPDLAMFELRRKGSEHARRISTLIVERSKL